MKRPAKIGIIIAAIVVTGAIVTAAIYALRKAHEQQMRETALAELKAVTVDDKRGDWTHLAIFNPSAWKVSTTLGAVDTDTNVEYYLLNGTTRQFLYKETTGNHVLESRMHTDLRLRPYYATSTPDQIGNLPAGSRFVQKLILRFDVASRDGEFVVLKPPFELEAEREFVLTYTGKRESIEEIKNPFDAVPSFKDFLRQELKKEKTPDIAPNGSTRHSRK